MKLFRTLFKKKDMSESGYYPPGAENDPRAPWNETDNYELIVEISYYGEVILVKKTPISKDKWDEETQTIDPETFEEFCSIKLGIDYEELCENEESIDLEKVKEEGSRYKIITSRGEFTTSYDELEDLA